MFYSGPSRFYSITQITKNISPPIRELNKNSSRKLLNLPSNVKTEEGL